MVVKRRRWWDKPQAFHPRQALSAHVWRVRLYDVRKLPSPGRWARIKFTAECGVDGAKVKSSLLRS